MPSSTSSSSTEDAVVVEVVKGVVMWSSSKEEEEEEGSEEVGERELKWGERAFGGGAGKRTEGSVEGMQSLYNRTTARLRG